MEYSVKQLLNAACRIGRCLLENGGEIYRVESSIGYFLSAYGLEETGIADIAFQQHLYGSVVAQVEDEEAEAEATEDTENVG